MRYTKSFTSLLTWILAAAMTLSQAGYAQSPTDNFQIRREDPNVKQGGVYYTYNKKNEVLFKANIWGSVQYPGVHFLPLGTRFLDGLSIAGGPLDSANVDEITISSRVANTSETKLRTINIRTALGNQELNPILQPDDIIFVKENRAIQKTQIWLAFGTFLLTAASFAVLLSRDH